MLLPIFYIPATGTNVPRYHFMPIKSAGHNPVFEKQMLLTFTESK